METLEVLEARSGVISSYTSERCVCGGTEGNAGRQRKKGRRYLHIRAV